MLGTRMTGRPRSQAALASLALAGLAFAGVLAPGDALAGRSRPAPFAIGFPESGSNLVSVEDVFITLRYDANASPQAGCLDPSQPQGLCVRLNETFLPVPLGAIGASSTVLPMPAGAPLRTGRNVLSAFVRSSDPEASLNNGFLVRHRVFFYQDQDRDGIPDADEVGSGLTLTDSDGDGLLDGVERRVGVGTTEGIPGTSRTGAITVSAVRPTLVRRGRAFAIGGAGLEAIDQTGEAFLGGLLAPLLHIPSAPSPSALILHAPAGVGGTNAPLSLADAGGSSGFSTVSLDMDSAPMLQNVVLVSSIRAQQFFDEVGGLLSTRAHNIPLFVNMLPFGPATRVLVDATRIDPSFQIAVTPDLETVLRNHGGVTNVSTRLFGALSASVLQSVDLLVILVTVPVSSYTASELTAIRDWLRVPGRRLVVVADACCGPAPATSPPIANAVLAAVGAASRFDEFFPSAAEQEPVEYLTGGIFSDPPFTNGVNVLSYQMPGSILVGAGAVEAARVGICLLGETGVTVPGLDPVHPLLVACRVGEGPLLPVIEAPYVATETVTPGVPSVRIQRIAIGPTLAGAATVVSVPPLGFVELAPATQVTVEASFENVAPTSATLFAAGLTGPTTALPATVSTGARTLTRTVSIDPRQEAVSLRMEAQAPGIRVADSMILRPRRQRAKLHTVVFASAGGAPAIAADVLARNRRQAALELAAMCSPANGVFLTDQSGVPLPGLDPSFVELGSGVPVVAPEVFRLVLLEVDSETGDESLSEEAIQVALGNNPDGSPSDLIPDRTLAGPEPDAVRVFVVGHLLRAHLDGSGQRLGDPVSIPQDTETGTALFALALVGSDTAASDLVIAQAQSGDLEAGTLRTSRPVVSSLAHELLHALAAIQDNALETSPENGQLVDLPTPADPSAMNSFPFFRSLQIGATGGPVVVRDACEPFGGSIGVGPAALATVCRRMLEGFTCIGRDLDFTE